MTEKFFNQKEMIINELKKINLNDLEKRCWWSCTETFLTSFEPSKTLKDLLIKNEDLKTLEQKNGKFECIICEYWLDEKSFHYSLFFENDTVDITGKIECDFINRVLFVLSKQQ